MLCMNINLKSSQTPLPILKFGKDVASQASMADADSFLSNPKNRAILKCIQTDGY